MEKVHSAQELEALRDEILKERDTGQSLVTICTGTGCHAYGCMNVVSTFRNEIDKAGLSDTIKVRTTGCHGFCERGPLVVIYPQKIFYQRVQIDDVAEIVGTTLKDGKIIDRLLYTHPQTEKIATYEQDVPFYNLQKRIIFGDNGLIDPTSLEDYLAIGGYKAFAKVLAEMSPEDVLEEIKKSVKDIRETLLARIIPDMPLEGDTREYITKIINQFEFEWYLEQIEKKTAEKIFNTLKCPECNYCEDFEEAWRMLVTHIDRVKKEFMVKENE